MKKTAALLIALALIFGLCACSQSASVTWQEQYDLGVRYLSEGNYQEAIIAFTAAIEIDPKQADAYIGLADAYIAQGDVEQARQVLADALSVVTDPNAIQSRLDGLEWSETSEPMPGMTVEPTQGPTSTPEPSATPGSTSTSEPTSTPGTTPAPTPNNSQTVGTPEVTVAATGIRADSVVNSDGYGSLKINGDLDMDWDTGMDVGTPAQLALINRSGTFVLPYQADTVGDSFAGDADIFYSNGIVSLSLSRAYYNGGIPQYFNLNGTPAFVLEKTEKEYTDEGGWIRHIRTSYLGGPMRDGYAVVIQKISDDTGGMGDNKTLIIDRNGKVTCELPQAFNQTIAWGMGGFDTEMSLGWCGEGLFAFFQNSYDENWNYATEGKGYMDPTGKTVIDLEGRGFQNLGPFTNGLAWVVDEAGNVGFIDKTGALVIPCVYEGLGEFSNDGLAFVKKDGKWGYIDRTGKTIIPFEYDAAYGAGNGLAAVVKDGKCGLVDYNNTIVVPLEYDDISSFEGGVAYAIRDGLVYIINSR